MPSVARVLLFLLLGFVDLSLSWLLFCHEDGASRVTEANPLASTFFANYGWTGMAALKAACSGIVLAACFVLAPFRKPLADRMLGIGLTIVGGVIGYSCVLTAYLGATRTPVVDYIPPPTRNKAETQAVFQVLRDRLASDLLQGKCCLASAAQEIDTRLKSGSQWNDLGAVQALYPDKPYVCGLHTALLEETLRNLRSRNSYQSRSYARRLVKEYRAFWPGPLPAEVRSLMEEFELDDLPDGGGRPTNPSELIPWLEPSF